jgi:hypothetical protein
VRGVGGGRLRHQRSWQSPAGHGGHRGGNSTLPRTPLARGTPRRAATAPWIQLVVVCKKPILECK